MCRLIVVLGLGGSVHAQSSVQSVDEYQVKAAFLYNFTKFIEWPPGSFKGDNDPVRICILGQSAIGQPLEQAVRGKVIGARAIVVTKISSTRQSPGCQILFICSSEQKRLSLIFKALPLIGILTVGETDGFAAKGGVVNLRLESGRIQLEINLDTSENAKLLISSKLLSLATIVKADVPK
jgi:hypothetical protein